MAMQAMAKQLFAMLSSNKKANADPEMKALIELGQNFVSGSLKMRTRQAIEGFKYIELTFATKDGAQHRATVI